MNNRINLANAKCTSLVMQAPVQFAAENAGANDFEVAAYTGRPVDRAWGQLIIDLSGIQAKQKMPVLQSHDSKKIVGFSTKAWTETDGFFIGGKFSKSTDAAADVRQLAEEGFPWQASIGVKPTVVVEIQSGTAMSVNGFDIAGPAEVWTAAEVYETSFVPLGADGDTSVSLLTKFEEKFHDGSTDMKNIWDKSASLRAEFDNDFEAFAHYEKAYAAGKIRLREKSQIPDSGGNGSARLAWDASPTLRSEFLDDFAAFKLFTEADALGKIRISGGN